MVSPEVYQDSSSAGHPVHGREIDDIFFFFFNYRENTLMFILKRICDIRDTLKRNVLTEDDRKT